MSPGPLRQAVGVVGLVALVPTAVLLAGGALAGREAAMRAVVTLLGVVLIGRLVGAWLQAAAGKLEATATATATATADLRPGTTGEARPGGAVDPPPRRRAGDAPDTSGSATAAGP